MRWSNSANNTKVPSPINLTRIGQLGGNAADSRAAFYTLATADLVTAFNQKCIFKDLVSERVLTSKKGAEFDIFGRKQARYHITGRSVLDDLNNSPTDRARETIYLDNLLIAHEVFDDLDMLMDQNYPLIRQETMGQLAHALAVERDKRTARIIFATSKRNTPQLAKSQDADRVGITRTLSAGYAAASKTTKGDELVSTIGDLLVAFERKNVPLEGLTGVVGPEEFDYLQDSTRVQNVDWGGGANGGIAAKPASLDVKGLRVIRSNVVNQAAYTLQPGDNGNLEYQQDMSKVRMLVFHKTCMGVVSLVRPQFSMTDPDGDFFTEYMSHLIVCRMAIGMKSVRPEGAASVSIP